MFYHLIVSWQYIQTKYFTGYKKKQTTNFSESYSGNVGGFFVCLLGLVWFGPTIRSRKLIHLWENKLLSTGDFASFKILNMKLDHKYREQVKENVINHATWKVRPLEYTERLKFGQ